MYRFTITKRLMYETTEKLFNILICCFSYIDLFNLQIMVFKNKLDRI
jgi:hypothetical protein